MLRDRVARRRPTREDRRRDGSDDRGERRRADDLRHVQVGRQGHRRSKRCVCWRRPAARAVTGVPADERIPVAVIVLSDRAASGVRPDACIPVDRARRSAIAYVIVDERVLADDAAALQAALIELCDRGVGLDPHQRRDGARAARPHAAGDRAVLDYEVPGIAEAMRAASLRVDQDRDALARGRRGARPHADREPAREPEGGPRDAGGHFAGASARARPAAAATSRTARGTQATQ